MLNNYKMGQDGCQPMWWWGTTKIPDGIIACVTVSKPTALKKKIEVWGRMAKLDCICLVCSTNSSCCHLHRCINKKPTSQCLRWSVNQEANMRTASLHYNHQSRSKCVRHTNTHKGKLQNKTKLSSTHKSLLCEWGESGSPGTVPMKVWMERAGMERTLRWRPGITLTLSLLSVWLTGRCGIDAETAAGLSSFSSRTEGVVARSIWYSRDVRVAVPLQFTEGWELGHCNHML